MSPGPRDLIIDANLRSWIMGHRPFGNNKFLWASLHHIMDSVFNDLSSEELWNLKLRVHQKIEEFG